MNAAANYAFANSQLMAHYARRALGTVFGEDTARRTRLVYDVCHNIAKHETHEVSGARTRLCVHRKGATRAFPPGHPELAPQFRDIGQPVLIPGDMGRYSRSEEHTSELQSQSNLVCRLLLEKKKISRRTIRR